MSAKRYLLTCQNCGANRQVGIVKGMTGQIIDWLDNNPDPQKVKIISGRFRFDDEWGWQCICGNDDLWTEQEKSHVENLTNPEPKEITDIMNDLKPQKPKFRMVNV